MCVHVLLSLASYSVSLLFCMRMLLVCYHCICYFFSLFFLRLLFHFLFSFCFFLFFLCPVLFCFVFFHTPTEPTRRDENKSNRRRNHARNALSRILFSLSLSLSIILISISRRSSDSFRVIKITHQRTSSASILFAVCQLVVLVVVLFTVHCKMDSSPIVTTHTNNKSKSSRKSQ